MDFFRGKYSWAKLERLIDKLPARSRLGIAQAEDEELAEQVLAAQQDEPVSRAPSLEEWTPEVQYLAAAVDRLGELIVTTVAAAGGKPPRVRPLRRPRTAFDRVRERRAWAKYDALVGEVEQAQARWAAKRSAQRGG